jgi:hypothetical protein
MSFVVALLPRVGQPRVPTGKSSESLQPPVQRRKRRWLVGQFLAATKRALAAVRSGHRRIRVQARLCAPRTRRPPGPPSRQVHRRFRENAARRAFIAQPYLPAHSACRSRQQLGSSRVARTASALGRGRRRVEGSALCPRLHPALNSVEDESAVSFRDAHGGRKGACSNHAPQRRSRYSDHLENLSRPDELHYPPPLPLHICRPMRVQTRDQHAGRRQSSQVLDLQHRALGSASCD